MTADNQSRAYGAPNPTLTATISGFANSETLASSGVTGTASCSTTATVASPASTPTYPITCTIGTLASSKYTFSFVAGVLTINKASQTITGFAPSSPLTYSSGGTFTLSATGGASGNPVIFGSTTASVCTVSGSTANIVSAGTCSLTADQAGNGNYEAASQVIANVVINKASQTIIFGALAAKTFGDADFTVSATGGPSGNPVTFSSQTTPVCTVSGNTVHILTAGGCTIRASQTGNTNYAAAADVDQSFTINKATPIVTVSGGPFTYNGNPHAATVAVTGVGSVAVNGTMSVTYNGSATVPTHADTYAVNVSFISSDTNYSNANGSGSITIEKASSTTVVSCPASVIYDGAAQTPCTAAVTGVGGLNQVLSVTYANNINAGTATASASFDGDANHNDSSDSKNFTIEKAASVTSVSCPASVIYNGAAQTPCTAAVTGVGGLNQVLSVTYANNINAGTATASASFDGDANHNGSSDSKNFTIEKAATVTTVTCGAGPFTYNGNPHTPCSASVTGPGLNESLTVNYTDNVNAGMAAASASYAESANYLGSTDSKNFTIEKAASVTSVSCPASVIYNGAAQTPCTAAVTGVGGLNQVLSVTYANNINAGTATASASFDGDANHNGSTDSKSFTIEKASSTTTVTFESGPYMYRGTAFTATAGVMGVGGLNQALAVVYTGHCTNVTVANGCIATATFAGDANHNGSGDTKNITINRRPITVTADAKTKTYSESDPALTYQVTSGSLIFTDTFTGALSRVAGELVGTYAIQQGNLVLNSNYILNYIGANLTITTGFAFNGFYSPIGGSVENSNGGSYANPIKSFKLGSTIPVKFGTIWLKDGAALITGVQTLQAVKYSNATDSDPPIDATPTDAATDGNHFRLTGTDWHFNLSTKSSGFSAGTWLLIATLQDGSKHTVWISIKK